ncbi:hypothetical protein PILCRDRAFT_813031 [Piloderma croceum F 1598]|uniref:Uncharacterized protein n=1 Tax=Piloderma croceum (strain F 1598) TaxID=765440 RepID=A0A0C3CH96_PILCF|nr:hypothetical protein PILCRDRAFT_813031 [Piloderma croceum F 1598]
MSEDIEPADNSFPAPTYRAQRFPLHHAIATIIDESHEGVIRAAHHRSHLDTSTGRQRFQSACFAGKLGEARCCAELCRF